MANIRLIAQAQQLDPPICALANAKSSGPITPRDLFVRGHGYHDLMGSKAAAKTRAWLPLICSVTIALCLRSPLSFG